MTLCVFALIASEFMPVSLLTPIAGDLHVTQGMAGQGIAISGAFAVVTSLFISTLAGSMNRKTLLLALTGLDGPVRGHRRAWHPTTSCTWWAVRSLALWWAGFGRCRQRLPCGWCLFIRCRAPWRFSTAAMRWRQ
jgi:hypothetical protein